MRVKTAIVVMIATPLLFACSDDDSTNVDVTMHIVAGTYIANNAKTGSKLDAVQAGSATNWLAQGVTIQLKLNENGTTSGTMFVPAIGTEPASTSDLTGTWTLNGNIVELSHSADTLLRDISFTADGDRLTGTLTNSSGVTTVVLVK